MVKRFLTTSVLLKVWGETDTTALFYFPLFEYFLLNLITFHHDAIKIGG